MTKYYIDEAKGVVVCILGDTSNDAHHHINKRMRSQMDGYIFSDKYEMPERFRGVARCNFEAGDTFDVEVGKKLALGRAIDKYSASKQKMLDKFKSDMESFLETL